MQYIFGDLSLLDTGYSSKAEMHKSSLNYWSLYCWIVVVMSLSLLDTCAFSMLCSLYKSSLYYWSLYYWTVVVMSLSLLDTSHPKTAAMEV